MSTQVGGTSGALSDQPPCRRLGVKQALNLPIASLKKVRFCNFVKRVHGPASLHLSHPGCPPIWNAPTTHPILLLNRSGPDLFYTFLQLYLKCLHFILQSQSLFSVFRRELKQMRQKTPCFSFQVKQEN